jgi:hypothetical protein
MKTVKETHALASKLFILSLTPAALIGIPRQLSGKWMGSWNVIAGLYCSAGAANYLLSPFIKQHLSDFYTGFHFAIYFVLIIAVLRHVFMIYNDARMFWRMKNRLEKVIVEFEAAQLETNNIGSSRKLTANFAKLLFNKQI